MRATYFLALTLFLFSCSETEKKNISSNKEEKTDSTVTELVEENKLESTNLPTQDTIIKASLSDNKSKSTKKEVNPIKDLTASSNDFLNGGPITENLILSKKILDTHPDTLHKIAKSSYEGMAARNAFPVSIADDFEKGVSKEKIHYTPVTFHYIVYEKANQKTFHTEKFITVKKDKNNKTVSE